MAQAAPAAPATSRPVRRQPSAVAATAAPSRYLSSVRPPAAAACQPRLWQQQLVIRSSRNISSRSAAGSEAGVAIPAPAVPEVAAAELSAEGQQQWVECAAILAERCGLDGAAAELALLKAFGWKGQGFWRQERVKEPPTTAQVSAALDLVQGLGVGQPEELGKLVGTFPEVLALSVELMQDNVRVLQDKWSMKGAVLCNAVKRKPRVLANNLDCEGTCAGLCTRCWAQF